MARHGPRRHGALFPVGPPLRCPRPYDPPAPFKAALREDPLRRRDRVHRHRGGAASGGTARRRAVLDDTLVVVAADHGESLGEHGESTHGVFLYDATIHVPLVVKFPRGQGPVPARASARGSASWTLRRPSCRLPASRYRGRCRACRSRRRQPTKPDRSPDLLRNRLPQPRLRLESARGLACGPVPFREGAAAGVVRPRQGPSRRAATSLPNAPRSRRASARRSDDFRRRTAAAAPQRPASRRSIPNSPSGSRPSAMSRAAAPRPQRCERHRPEGPHRHVEHAARRHARHRERRQPQGHPAARAGGGQGSAGLHGAAAVWHRTLARAPLCRRRFPRCTRRSRSGPTRRWCTTRWASRSSRPAT